MSYFFLFFFNFFPFTTCFLLFRCWLSFIVSSLFLRRSFPHLHPLHLPLFTFTSFCLSPVLVFIEFIPVLFLFIPFQLVAGTSSLSPLLPFILPQPFSPFSFQLLLRNCFQFPFSDGIDASRLLAELPIFLCSQLQPHLVSLIFISSGTGCRGFYLISFLSQFSTTKPFFVPFLSFFRYLC